MVYEMGYEVTSYPPLVAEHLPETTSLTGTIDFVNMPGSTRRFCVGWSQASPGQLQCSISTDLQPGHHGIIQEQMAPTVNLEFESRDACMTTPLEKLCESKSIILPGILASRIKVWISISREIFIGRSRFELEIHAKFVPNRTYVRMTDTHKGEIVQLPIRVADESLRPSHRQRSGNSTTDEEQQKTKMALEERD